jgi:hypothetical protein
MKTETSAAFTLTGLELDPDAASARLGIVPTKTWRAGDPIDGRTTLRYRHSGWRLQSALGKSAHHLEDHIETLLAQLQPAWSPLTGLCARYDGEFSCVIRLHPDDQAPAMHFANDVIGRIAELNAEIDIDLYILPRVRDRRDERAVRSGQPEHAGSRQ